MSEQETVTIEVDGRAVEAVKGEMVIAATDRAGIHIPRFCYHKHLPIAANCRMCLVDVEKAPKPMPACATAVADGMKITTDSQRAIAAQRGVMEFLLINHPLDCPICDQGGECELQDLALGFGRGVSRFTEGKRSVEDEDLGPLVATEMTRCIHCTRCVRFLDTVAGKKELGGMFRGERTEIKTYVGEGIRSELSGNVIDLCPVGALTNKPFRFRARSWEMLSFPAVSPHDGVGSNMELHTLRDRIMRVVPRENEAINQTWLADRDRYGIEGLYSEDRLERPMIKEGGQWREVPWEIALRRAAESLRGVASHFGPEALGALLAPTATLEELYLAGQLVRGLGSGNVDHRLREGDTSDQAEAPPFPYMGQRIEELADKDAVLLVGAYTRHEQPMINHRLRQATNSGAAVMTLNPRRFEWNFEPVLEHAVAPGRMVAELAAVACALAKGGKGKGADLPDGVEALAAKSETAQRIAERLKVAERPAVLAGNMAAGHPEAATLRALGTLVAELAGGPFGVLAEAANTAGGWLAGAVPHRLAGGAEAPLSGLSAREMVERGLRGYLLLNVEPEADLWNPAAARQALSNADSVVAITVYAGDALKESADVLLPMGGFGETAGTFVNSEGRWQSFRGVTSPLGEARPGWKILRALGTVLELEGFELDNAEEVYRIVAAACEGVAPGSRYPFHKGAASAGSASGGTELAGAVPIYSGDPLVRRSQPLQHAAIAGQAEAVAAAETAGRIGATDGGMVRLEAEGGAVELPLRIDEAIPADTIWVPAALRERVDLGPPFGRLTVTAV